MKKIRSGTGWIIVDAHDRSSPSEPYDKWGNLKSAKKKKRRRRRRNAATQVSLPKVY